MVVLLSLQVLPSRLIYHFTPGLQLVDFISSAAMMFDRDAGGCGLQRLGILAVGPGLGHEECPAPGPDLVLTCGVPLAFEQGAEGVCTAIGDLVGHGVLPVLTEVSMLWYSCSSLQGMCSAVFIHG